MFEIKEIPIGTIPNFSSKIYPEYLEGEYIKTFPVFQQSDGASYNLKLKTLVPIERNDIKYLIPFAKSFEESSLTRTIEGHKESKLKYKLSSNKECDKIIEKYIVPDPKDYENSNGGCKVVIYKYKENV